MVRGVQLSYCRTKVRQMPQNVATRHPLISLIQEIFGKLDQIIMLNFSYVLLNTDCTE